MKKSIFFFSLPYKLGKEGVYFTALYVLSGLTPEVDRRRVQKEISLRIFVKICGTVVEMGGKVKCI